MFLHIHISSTMLIVLQVANRDGKLTFVNFVLITRRVKPDHAISTFAFIRVNIKIY